MWKSFDVRFCVISFSSTKFAELLHELIGQIQFAWSENRTQNIEFKKNQKKIAKLGQFMVKQRNAIKQTLNDKTMQRL